jgi:hypothetical protein
MHRCFEQGIDSMTNYFLENAKLISKLFGITPVLYGSVSLEYLIGKPMGADDIDILIPRIFLRERWDEFRGTLENFGYSLIDEKEHTFLKNQICFSYAEVEELESFAGIKYDEIQLVEKDKIEFKLLSLEQLLKVYQKSSKDGYRIITRNKKDLEKIRIILHHLGFKRGIR